MDIQDLESGKKVTITIENGEPQPTTGEVKGVNIEVDENGKVETKKSGVRRTIQCSQCKTRAKISAKIAAKLGHK